MAHLVERGAALPALPQTRRLQALEDGRERTAGAVSPWAGIAARPRHTATYGNSQLTPGQDRTGSAKDVTVTMLKSRSEPREMKFTSFPELGIAVVTHFGHPVFEVLEWVSVPGTSAAHHLLRETEGKKTVLMEHFSPSPTFGLKGETNVSCFNTINHRV